MNIFKVCLFYVMNISIQDCLCIKNYLIVFSDLIHLNFLKENFHQCTKERKEHNISLELSRDKKRGILLIFCRTQFVSSYLICYC